MKTADVIIGHTYLTKSGANLVKITVQSATAVDGRVKFAVARAPGRPLPKLRSAAALRPDGEETLFSARDRSKYRRIGRQPRRTGALVSIGYSR